MAIQQYGGDQLSRKARLWRYLKYNQGCQTQCVSIHREHTDKDDTTYIDIVALYRNRLKDEAYLASQKSAYASRKQHPGEDPVSYANLVSYLENEAMSKLYDRQGNEVHSQPIESFVNRVVWGLDKHWMKQRLIWKMSTDQIKTREDVQKCLTQAVNELRLSKENNIDPSCVYPNTMSNLNADRYALSAPDVPGRYDTQPDQGVSVLVEEAL